jgi:Rod binding domain-containing protein
MWDLAAQQFSQLLASRGGLGLAKLIAPKLDKTVVE